MGLPEHKAKAELMGVCPYMICGKVIFREGDLEYKTNSPPLLSITTMCPHCKKRVRIKFHIGITITPLAEL